MSDDLVKRLRDVDWWRAHCEVSMKAADEIERLREAEQFILLQLEHANTYCHDRNKEVERLRETLDEITNSPNELRNATPSDYARGFNDGRWRMQQIARDALSPPVKEDT